ncbi:MAG: CAAX prenyl protease-related protein [Verrucomicrobiota bacterium]
MNQLQNKIEKSPILLRVLPFFVFALLTFFQGKFGEASRYWLYFIKTILGAGMIWAIRPHVAEMRWKISWEAVVIGIAVFGIWVGLDKFYPHLGGDTFPWNPQVQFGKNSGRAWLFIATRVIGSSLIVPPLEEIFYRSFLYRYIIQKDFLGISLNHFRWSALLVTSAIFGVVHHEWLAGILCGLAYQGLVLRKNRLGDAMTAHAITNFLLALWVVWRGDWKFW